MIPPGSGFSPAGSSGGHGVGSFVPNRTRTAVAGLNRYAIAGSLRRPRLGRLTERRHVVENPEAAAVRAGDEIGAQTGAVVLHLNVAHRNRRHVELERLPVIAVVERHPHLQLGRGVQQTLLARIFANRVRDAPGAMPVLISVHVLPPSCVRQKCGFMSSIRIVFAAAYAVRLSK